MWTLILFKVFGFLDKSYVGPSCVFGLHNCLLNASHVSGQAKLNRIFLKCLELCWAMKTYSREFLEKAPLPLWKWIFRWSTEQFYRFDWLPRFMHCCLARRQAMGLLMMYCLIINPLDFPPTLETNKYTRLSMWLSSGVFRLMVWSTFVQQYWHWYDVSFELSSHGSLCYRHLWTLSHTESICIVSAYEVSWEHHTFFIRWLT